MLNIQRRGQAVSRTPEAARMPVWQQEATELHIIILNFAPIFF